ncbi:hypothetical protein [Leptolyngbya sp. 7M]|uniref:hypothetical protein n=1 Tax=Leptolyngbya sp. 7M TaxID=2812896 RepID=UPI001B8B4542|nr:hypothetical protein [Leptolyngbya sp. 7M]QYO64374.1 hypothetical protein JVX88_32570 [Leptolyngbya sp. 7M]
MDIDSATATFVMKMAGERLGFHRTAILRQHPFREDLPTRFIPEGRVWLDIARNYKTRFIEDPARIFHDHREARLSGLDRMQRAWGDSEYYRFALRHYAGWWRTTPVEVAKLAIGLRRAEFHLGCREDREELTGLARLWAVLATPAAMVAYARDMRVKYGSLGTRLLIARQLCRGKGGRRLSKLLFRKSIEEENLPVVVHAGGVTLAVDATDPTNCEVLFSPRTANASVLSYLTPQARAFRRIALLGSNVSYAACRLARIAGSGSTILAIEPTSAQTERTRLSARASYLDQLEAVTVIDPDPQRARGCQIVHFGDEVTALNWYEAIAALPEITIVTIEAAAPSTDWSEKLASAGFNLKRVVAGEFSAWERAAPDPRRQDSE